MTVDQRKSSNAAPGSYHLKVFDSFTSLSNRTALLIIVGIAIALRLMSAAYQGSSVVDLPGVSDQISYDELARRVVDGHGFSFAEGHWPATRAGEPTAHWSYLYTLYLAAVYKLFGSNPVLARMIQALIAGIFQPILLWRIGNRLFSRSVGLVSAALIATYVYFFYYAGALVTETFYITGILWILDSSLRITSKPRNAQADGRKTILWQWLELGFAMGVTVLLRQVFLLFLPFLFLWIWWNLREMETERWKQVLRWSALKSLSIAALILVLMIVPFTIRNQRVFGTFTLLNTNAGFAFFWGNHPVHGTEFIPVLPSGSIRYYDLIPKELLSLNEAEMDKALLRIGVQYVLDDPGRFVLLSISRLEEYFKFWPSSDSGPISNISRVGSFGISLPFILYGLWIALVQQWRSQTSSERWRIVLLLMFILIYTGMHLLSWTLIRYRLPVDAILIVFTGLGITTLLEKNPSKKRKSAAHV